MVRCNRHKSGPALLLQERIIELNYSKRLRRENDGEQKG